MAHARFEKAPQSGHIPRTLQQKDNNQSHRTPPHLRGPLTTHIDIPGFIEEYRMLPASGRERRDWLDVTSGRLYAE
eukprot:1131016-Pyramimonas_sp.AAC.1